MPSRSARPAPPDETSPPVADMATLGIARRRVSAGRIAVWAALAAGPAALVLAVLPAPRTVAAAPKKVAIPAASTATEADPSGYAELLLSSWLSSSEDETSEAARRVQAMAPGTALPEKASPAASVTAVAASRTAADRWQVTVAAADKAGGVRYFALPLAAAGDRFAVLAGPAEVAAPTPATAPESGSTVSVPAGRPLAATVAEFLTAYLSGGQIARYAVPGVQLNAPQAAYLKVEAEQISADSQEAAGESVADDGTSVRVRVGVRAEDAKGNVWPLDYGLALTSRAGRWEIASLSASSLTPAGSAR